MASNPKSDNAAIVRVPDRTPAPLAGLARRTLATLKDPEPGDGPRSQPIVDADGRVWYPTIEEAIAAAGGYVELVAPSTEALVCRFCGHSPADRADRLGRGECADADACRRREIATGLRPHQAVYPKYPPNDPDGPLCACGRRVFDPIHGPRQPAGGVGSVS
jgi:hypothetical protein